MESIDFKMPRMGESIKEGTIIEWHVMEGEYFEKDAVLLEVATDKVDNEVTAPFPGRLISIKFPAGEAVPVGTVIAVLEPDPSAGTAAPDPGPVAPEKIQKPVSSPKKPRPAQTARPPAFQVRENVFISPLVDSIARAHHISYDELARIPGSGTDNRLRKSDVMQYIREGRPFQFAQPAVPDSGFQIPDLKFDKGTGTIVEMDRMRQLIADHMVFSKHTSPHVTAYVEADLTEMAAWREAQKEPFLKKHGQRLTFTPLFIEAVVRAIKDFPMINSSLDGKNIIVKDEINIGMATALPTGNLIVPVIKNADTLSLPQLAAAANNLAEKARDNRLSADDTRGSTFTISNVGTFGSLMGTPIINQPEAAILATGVIKKRAEVMERPEGDTIEIRQMMILSLSFDHRIVDGYLAGSFLRRIADYMEEKR